MIDLAIKLGSWNWLILGVLLMGIEALAPGVFMLWLGLAALIVGLLSFLFVASWQMQVVAFALISIAMVPLWRHFARREAVDNNFLNRRTKGLVGQVVTLESAIVDGVGSIRLGDTTWRVEGPPLAAGTKVRIVEADGVRLRVGPA